MQKKSTKTLITISTYLCIVKAPTLNLLTIMFALAPYANEYNTNPIVFPSFNGALTNMITLDLTKSYNSLIKYINVP
jgi:hypothetical protein